MDDESWRTLPGFREKLERAKQLAIKKVNGRGMQGNSYDSTGKLDSLQEDSVQSPRPFYEKADRLVRLNTGTNPSISTSIAQSRDPLPSLGGLVPGRKIISGANTAAMTEPLPTDATTASAKKFNAESGPPKKKLKTGPQPEQSSVTPIVTRTTRHSSEWYENINMRQKFSRRDLDSLKAIYSLIQECSEKAEFSHKTEISLQRLRTRLHQAEFYDFLSGVLIKKSKLLEEGGLSKVYNAESSPFPWDIRADSLALHQRWLYGRLDPHLLVGIDSKHKTNTAGKTVKTRNLNRDYQGLRSANCIGENDLINGDWWPLRICALRDGAHGEIEAGIHGQSGKGAYSVVMSNGGYADIDNGESITYCGTAGFDSQPSAGTTLLLEALKLRSPIRVLRSSALPASNRYRPQKGLRYDGLYNIDSFTILDTKTAMYAFAMNRMEGQAPMRWQGVERRPTDEQVGEYAKICQLMGLVG